MLLNSSSLRTLLHGEKKKTIRPNSTSKVIQLLDDVVREETSKTEIKSRRRKVRINVSHSVLNDSFKQIQDISSNEYIKLVDIGLYFGSAKNDTLLLEKKLKLIQHEVDNIESRIRFSYQQVSQNAVKFTPDDAVLVLTYANIPDIDVEYDTITATSFINSDDNSVIFDKWLIYVLSKVKQTLMIRHIEERHRKQTKKITAPPVPELFLLTPPIMNMSVHTTGADFFETQRSSEVNNRQVVGGKSAKSLPPVLLKRFRSKQIIRKLIDEEGYDEALGRDTPRCLRGGETNITIEELRRELQIAQKGLAQLDTLVNNNIVWVQNNCDTSAVKTISTPAVQKCREIAIRKLTETLGGFIGSTKHWALLRWQAVAKYQQQSQTVVAFSKAKGIDIIAAVLTVSLRRQYSSGWLPWKSMYIEHKRMRKFAAAVNMQRIIRGHLGRMEVTKLVQQRTNELKKELIQVEKEAARQHKIFEAKQRKLRAEEEERMLKAQKDIRIIQDFYKGKLAIKKAKEELERRRAERAAVTVQKMHRGHRARRTKQMLAEEDEKRRQVAQRELELEQERTRRAAQAEASHAKSQSPPRKALSRPTTPAASRATSPQRPKTAASRVTTPLKPAIHRAKTPEIPIDSKVIKGVVDVQSLFRRKKAMQEAKEERARLARMRAKQLAKTPKRPEKSIGIAIHPSETAAIIKLQSVIRGKLARATKNKLGADKEKTRERYFAKSKRKSTATPLKTVSPVKRITTSLRVDTLTAGSKDNIESAPSEVLLEGTIEDPFVLPLSSSSLLHEGESGLSPDASDVLPTEQVAPTLQKDNRSQPEPVDTLLMSADLTSTSADKDLTIDDTPVVEPVGVTQGTIGSEDRNSIPEAFDEFVLPAAEALSEDLEELGGAHDDEEHNTVVTATPAIVMSEEEARVDLDEDEPDPSSELLVEPAVLKTADEEDAAVDVIGEPRQSETIIEIPPEVVKAPSTDISTTKIALKDDVDPKIRPERRASGPKPSAAKSRSIETKMAPVRGSFGGASKVSEPIKKRDSAAGNKRLTPAKSDTSSKPLLSEREKGPAAIASERPTVKQSTTKSTSTSKPVSSATPARRPSRMAVRLKNAKDTAQPQDTAEVSSSSNAHKVKVMVPASQEEKLPRGGVSEDAKSAQQGVVATAVEADSTGAAGPLSASPEKEVSPAPPGASTCRPADEGDAAAAALKIQRLLKKKMSMPAEAIPVANTNAAVHFTESVPPTIADNTTSSRAVAAGKIQRLMKRRSPTKQVEASPRRSGDTHMPAETSSVPASTGVAFGMDDKALAAGKIQRLVKQRSVRIRAGRRSLVPAEHTAPAPATTTSSVASKTAVTPVDKSLNVGVTDDETAAAALRIQKLMKSKSRKAAQVKPIELPIRVAAADDLTESKALAAGKIQRLIKRRSPTKQVEASPRHHGDTHVPAESSSVPVTTGAAFGMDEKAVAAGKIQRLVKQRSVRIRSGRRSVVSAEHTTPASSTSTTTTSVASKTAATPVVDKSVNVDVAAGRIQKLLKQHSMGLATTKTARIVNTTKSGTAVKRSSVEEPGPPPLQHPASLPSSGHKDVAAAKIQRIVKQRSMRRGEVHPQGTSPRHLKATPHHGPVHHKSELSTHDAHTFTSEERGKGHAEPHKAAVAVAGGHHHEVAAVKIQSLLRGANARGKHRSSSTSKDSAEEGVATADGSNNNDDDVITAAVAVTDETNVRARLQARRLHDGVLPSHSHDDHIIQDKEEAGDVVLPNLSFESDISHHSSQDISNAVVMLQKVMRGHSVRLKGLPFRKIKSATPVRSPTMVVHEAEDDDLAIKLHSEGALSQLIGNSLSFEPDRERGGADALATTKASVRPFSSNHIAPIVKRGSNSSISSTDSRKAKRIVSPQRPKSKPSSAMHKKGAGGKRGSASSSTSATSIETVDISRVPSLVNNGQVGDLVGTEGAVTVAAEPELTDEEYIVKLHEDKPYEVRARRASLNITSTLRAKRTSLLVEGDVTEDVGDIAAQVAHELRSSTKSSHTAADRSRTEKGVVGLQSLYRRKTAVQVVQKKRELLTMTPKEAAEEARRANERGLVALQSLYRQRAAKEAVKKKRENLNRIGLRANFPVSPHRRQSSSNSRPVSSGVARSKSSSRPSSPRDYGADADDENTEEDTGILPETAIDPVDSAVEPEILDPITYLNQCAIKIQAAERRRQAIKRVVAKRALLIPPKDLQPKPRPTIVLDSIPEEVKQERRLQAAAMRIQQFARVSIARREVLRRREFAALAETNKRKMLDGLATCIQKYVRGSLARKRVKRFIKENKAAYLVAKQKQELEDRLRHVEELEKKLQEREEKMLEATRAANEKADALTNALKVLEERANREEAEKAARNILMQSGSILEDNSASLDTQSFVVDGSEWTKLWDASAGAWYWYCQTTGVSQWEDPTATSLDDGYESSGGLTDYSTDQYGSEMASEYGEGEASEWEEFWDEQAQSKYFYNNITGEATWAKPEKLKSLSSKSSMASMPAAVANEADDWISCIDESIGQEYWYNTKTGETSWTA